jgi:hypothetical protein
MSDSATTEDVTTSEHDLLIASKQIVDETRRLEWQVAQGEAEVERIKEEMSDAKKELKEREKRLRDFIRDSNDPQMTMDFDDAKDPSSPESKPETSSKSLHWRSISIREAKVSKAIIDDLISHEIETLGDWEDLQTGRNTTHPTGASEWKGWGDARINRMNTLVSELVSNAVGSQAVSDTTNDTTNDTPEETHEDASGPISICTPEVETENEVESAEQPESAEEYEDVESDADANDIIQKDDSTTIRVLKVTSLLTDRGVEPNAVIYAVMSGVTAVVQFADNIETTLMPDEFEAV